MPKSPAESPRRPKALRPGSRVGLVAPCSPFAEPEDYVIAAEIIRSLGFEPVFSEHATAKRGYLAGQDAQRAADLLSAFEDPSLDGIWCLRGGYGALRLLDLIPWDRIAAHPKVFVGYSDVTALHVALLQKANMVGFHGPVAGADLAPFAVDEMRRVLGTSQPAGRVGAPSGRDTVPGTTEREHRLSTLVGGVAEAPLIGGNLSLLTRLLGTPYAPDFRGRILFMEEVGESNYRVDGMLAQLRLAGAFRDAKGIVLGKFSEPAASGQPSVLSLGEVFDDFLGDLPIPVLRGLRVGHIADQTTLPLGVMARLDADAGSLELLEAAVV